MSGNITFRFQTQWVLRFVVVSVLGSGILFLTLRSAFNRQLGEDYGDAFSTLVNLDTLMLPIIGFSILFYTAVVCILATVIILYLSRAVAAPLFLIEEVASHITRGDLSLAAESRSNEQLRGLVAETEALRRTYEEQLRSLRPHLEAIEVSWQRIDGSAGKTGEETATELRRIKEDLEAISDRLA